MKIILVLISCLMFSSSAYAQVTRVTGTVYDEKGAVVVGAKVILTENHLGVIITHSTQTNDAGRYELKSEPGVCKLEVSSPNRNFKPLMVKNYIVVSTAVMYRDIVLEFIKPKRSRKKPANKYPIIL